MQGSAPSLQADRTITASELTSNSPVITSGAIIEMESSDCQRGIHQLLKPLQGHWGAPTIKHAGAWSHTASGNGTPDNFAEP